MFSRWSFAGSIGWFGSVYASRLPLPLVSSTNALQPCEAYSSCVWSHFFTSNQPSTPLGPNDDQSTSLSSKFTWPQLKQVSIVVSFLVFGSYISRPRPVWLTGSSFADG